MHCGVQSVITREGVTKAADIKMLAVAAIKKPKCNGPGSTETANYLNKDNKVKLLYIKVESYWSP